jgi:hypothetical protein
VIKLNVVKILPSYTSGFFKSGTYFQIYRCVLAASLVRPTREAISELRNTSFSSDTTRQEWDRPAWGMRIFMNPS